MNKKFLSKNINKIIPQHDFLNPFIEKLVFFYVYQKIQLLKINKSDFKSYFNEGALIIAFEKSRNIFDDLFNSKLEIKNWDDYNLTSIHEYYLFLISEIEVINKFDKDLFMTILTEQVKLIFLNENIEEIKVFYDKNFDWKKYHKSVDLRIFFYQKLKNCVELMKKNYKLDFNDSYFYFVKILKEK